MKTAASRKIALSRIALPSIALILTSHDGSFPERLPTTNGEKEVSKLPLGDLQAFDFMKTIDLRDECSGRVQFSFDPHKWQASDVEDGDSDTDSIRTVFHSKRPGTSRGFHSDRSSTGQSKVLLLKVDVAVPTKDRIPKIAPCQEIDKNPPF